MTNDNDLPPRRAHRLIELGRALDETMPREQCIVARKVFIFNALRKIVRDMDELLEKQPPPPAPHPPVETVAQAREWTKTGNRMRQYECPTCGKRATRAIVYLNGAPLICNGLEFSKGPRS